MALAVGYKQKKEKKKKKEHQKMFPCFQHDTNCIH